MATRILHGIEFFEQLYGDHPRIIPVKFGDNPPSGLGDVVQSKLLTDNGQINDRHHRITIAHLKSIAQVS